MAVNWSDIGDKIIAIAPTIGGAIANVVLPGSGVLASAGINVLLSALGLAPDATPEDVNKALAGASPETLLALKRADQDFLVKMKDADIKIDEIISADRADARRRDVEITKAGGGNARANLLIVALFVFLGGGFWVLVARDVDANSLLGGMLSMAIGGALTALWNVYAFEFGSSRGSKEKTEALAGAISSASAAGWKIQR